MTSPPANKKASACDAGGETVNVIERREGNITTETAQEPISLDESKRLIELEAVIEAGQQVFQEVAAALLEIRDSRLYRADHPTFESYCLSQWGFSKTYANNLIVAGEVVKQLPPALTTIVVNEGQARALAKVPEVMRVKVITKASDNGKLTARKIRVAAGHVDHPRIKTADQELRESSAQEKVAKRWWIFTATPQKRGQFFGALLGCGGTGKDLGKVAVADKVKFAKQVMWWLKTSVIESE